MVTLLRFFFVIIVVMLLLAGNAWSVSIDADKIWLNKGKSDEDTIELRDIKAVNKFWNASFNWNPIDDVWELSSYSEELLDPVYVRVRSRYSFDAETGSITEDSIFQTRGYFTTYADVALPDTTTVSLQFQKLLGTQRQFKAYSDAGFPVPGTYTFTVIDNGVTIVEPVDFPGGNLPQFQNVSISKAVNGLDLEISFDPIAVPIVGFDPMEYRVRIKNLSLSSETMFERIYDTTFMTIKDVTLAPGEWYEVRITARTTSADKSSQLWSDYYSQHMIW